MNVFLVSQCSKRAMAEFRRILDQFAERRGDRTWQTAITQAGLDALRRLLRKTARKNTAVACHWIHGKDHSELLWIVGDARRFGPDGAVPTNMTRRNILRNEDENDWHSLVLIQALAALASLLHDLGKACLAFQQRLSQDALRERNLYRHEWISLRLFQAFVGNCSDAEWLKRLVRPSDDDDRSWLQAGRLYRDGLDGQAATDKPFKTLPPLAKAVAWLVVTHHRLPIPPEMSASAKRGDDRPVTFRLSRLDGILEEVDADWFEPVDRERLNNGEEVERYWRFSDGLPVTQQAWRKRASRIAKRLLAMLDQSDIHECLANPYVMHLSRLSLILADHYYSGLVDESMRLYRNPGYPLYANTRWHDGRRIGNQTLDEHLLGVEVQAQTVSHALPALAQNLPRFRHKALSKRSKEKQFQWQNRAADAAMALRERSTRQGAFLVNMASTGSGKTLANAKIMYGLADPIRGMRCAFALGLRTLTLQTGRSFERALGVSDDVLATLVGGSAARKLAAYHAEQAERSGSSSAQPLLNEEAAYVHFEGNDQDPILQRVVNDAQVSRLLAAPLLVCTVDHLMPATESLRGGRQIVPMLRLLTSDLVLDEPDDFDLEDLPALTRLVHWAGLLGARVLLSSATLPPALVLGLYMAYRDGRQWFQRNRGEPLGQPANICCAWFDEFATLQRDCSDDASFETAHASFVQKRCALLAQEPLRRRGRLLPLQLRGDKAELRAGLALAMRDAALDLHRLHHEPDPVTGKRVSFGLIRMANIDPLFDVALALYKLGAPAGIRIHLCVYHSQFPLLLRSDIENRLDTTLDRRHPQAVYQLPDIRRRLDGHAEDDHLFIVLGSPVTEVGRDHDYDWAVVEPSSMRSLIQLVGRILRHRPKLATVANVVVLNTNLRHWECPDHAAFRRPGFEEEAGPYRLFTHRLEDLARPQEIAALDARARILLPADELRPAERLVDLEHARMAGQMLPRAVPEQSQVKRRARLRANPGVDIPEPPLNASSHWHRRQAWLTGVLPRLQPFRQDDRLQVDLVLLRDDEADEGYALHHLVEGERYGEIKLRRIDEIHHRVPDSCVNGPGISPWARGDFLQVLNDYAQALGMDPEACAKRFAAVTLPDAEQGWRFHPVLGFSRSG